MLYMILGEDLPDSAARRAAQRPAHLARVQALQREGRLVLAGPRPRVDAADPGAAGVHGSLIVAEFPDLASARAWAEADPYATGGVFAQLTVQPFVRVLP